MYGEDKFGTPLGVCAQCKKPVEPFGTWRHRFISEDIGELCLDCARIFLPEWVAVAEAAEHDHPFRDEESR